MKSPAEVEVTPPRRVLGQLLREALAAGLPLAWLVAALADAPARSLLESTEGPSR